MYVCMYVCISLQTQEKRLRREEFWNFFSEILLKLHLEWKVQPKDGHYQGLFPKKNQGTFFDFQKKAGETFLLSLLAAQLDMTKRDS